MGKIDVKKELPNLHKRHRLGVYSMDAHFWHCEFERVREYLISDGMHPDMLPNRSRAGAGIYHNWTAHVWLNPHYQPNNAYGVSIVAHECFHVAEMIMQVIGQHHEQGTVNEPMAYLLDHLVYSFITKMSVK